MFGKRCTLCGGKLDSQGVCKECGLDNNKNDENYRVNRSSCDGQPLTHVHEEKYRTEPARQTQKPEPARRRQEGIGGQPGTVRRKKKRGCMITIIILVLVIVFLNVFGGVVSGIISSLREGDGISLGDRGGSEDPYANVTREIPEDGEQLEYQLDSGTYIVGVHIPEGIYEAETEDDFDVVSVHDYAEGIYLYEYKGKDGGNYLDDLRLYQGAEVEIDTMTPVTLSTSNAQTGIMSWEENPLTESYVLSKEQTAGENFEAGVYDLEVTEGIADITVEIVYPDGELYQEKSLYLGTEASSGTIYRNLVLPEDAVIRCEDDVTVLLTPSAVIESTDYFSYYENH